VTVAATQPLKTLIREELRAPVARIVREVVVDLVREELNGNGHAEMVLSGRGSSPERQKRNGGRPKQAEASATSMTRRTCRSCGGTKPLRAFEPRRQVCRTCRNADAIAKRKRRLARAQTQEEEESGLASRSSASERELTAAP
jgi:hypothetical protein